MAIPRRSHARSLMLAALGYLCASAFSAGGKNAPSEAASPGAQDAAQEPSSRPRPASTRPATRPQNRPPEHFTVPADAPVVRGTAWEGVAGIEPAPSEPAVMIQAHESLWLFDGTRISTFEPATGRWSSRAAHLPAALGEGASAAFDAARDVIY